MWLWNFLRDSFSLAPVTLTYPAKASSHLVCQLSAHATQINLMFQAVTLPWAVAYKSNQP